jgi:hypothetical protein
LDGLSIGVVSQDFTRAMITFIKVQILISKLTMASWLLSTFDVHDVFLARQNKHQPREEEQNKK